MGFFQSIFGQDTGAGFQASGVKSADLSGAQGGVNYTQDQQNALLSALQGQNGIGNQNQALQGLQNVAGQYQNLANGVGPNPAQAQLAQNTAANVAQTGALMAGQRGASQNVGLIARQAGQQGAMTQQQAAGQAATLQAQQQMAGLQGLGGAQANIANLATQQVGQQQSAAQAAAQTALQNQANVYGLQSNINTTNAGIAAGNQKAQAGLIGGVLGSVGAANATASGGTNAAKGGMVTRMADGGAIPQIVSPDAYSNRGPQSYLGRQIQGIGQNFSPGAQGALNQDTGASGAQSGKALFNIGKAAYKGGKSLYSYLTSPSDSAVTGADAFGEGASAIPGAEASSGGTAAGEAAEGTAAVEGGEGADALLALSDGGKIQPGYNPHQPDPSTVGGTLEDIMQYLGAQGGEVSAVLSPGEKWLGPKEVEEVKQGANPMAVGKTIPGKPKISGAKDSYANDTYHTKLEEGGIVVPRSRTQSKNPERASRDFVAATLAKRRGKR